MASALQDLQTIATRNAANYEWLKKRLEKAAQVLNDDLRKEFVGATFQPNIRRLVGKNGYILQWKLREKPGLPVSSNNQQSSIGIVVLEKA